MKRSLMRRMGLGMLGMACVGLAVVSSAQAQFRPAAFALNCTGSVAGPLHTRARLVGLIQVMHLASPLRFTASCQDGPSASAFPVITPQHGEVLKINLTVDVDKLDATGKVVATNQCTGMTLNGFISFPCLADEASTNQATVLTSISK
jgi:hypothetical protein